jgi:hypothetical protein
VRFGDYLEAKVRAAYGLPGDSMGRS